MSNSKSATGGRIVLAGNIRYSAATLSEAGPPLDTSVAMRSLGDAPHEDDWRQIELVPAENVDVLNAMFEEQHHMRNEHGSAHGFTALYVREEYPVPLASRCIERIEVLSLSPGGSTSPLLMGPSAGAYPVIGGELLEISDVGGLYFTSEAGILRNCGLFPKRGQPVPQDDVLEAVFSLGKKHSLLLVDWFSLQGFYLYDIHALVQWLGHELADGGEA